MGILTSLLVSMGLSRFSRKESVIFGGYLRLAMDLSIKHGEELGCTLWQFKVANLNITILIYFNLPSHHESSIELQFSIAFGK